MKTGFGVLVGIILIAGIFILIPRSEKKIVSDTDTCVSNKNKEVSPMNYEQVSATKAVIKTPKGDIELELYPNDAPKTVTNFATLAKNGFYDCLTFHRYEPGFVIQGGDPSGNGTGGESIYGSEFEDELNANTASYQAGYKQGVLAMANRGPNTNSSQFFIMLEDNDTLPKNYTIFGKVTAGIDVVQSIRAGDEITKIEISQ